MFQVFFINFGWFSQNESNSLEGALKIAKSAGFQSTILNPIGQVVASWCPLNGTTIHKNLE